MFGIVGYGNGEVGNGGFLAKVAICWEVAAGENFQCFSQIFSIFQKYLSIVDTSQEFTKIIIIVSKIYFYFYV